MSLLKPQMCINLENGELRYFTPTLESRYLQGFFGAVSMLGKTPKTQYTATPGEIINPTAMATRLRELADEIELQEESK